MLSPCISQKAGVLGRVGALCLGLLAASAGAQDFERYRPKIIPQQPQQQRVIPGKLPPVEGSDRILVESLDAVVILDHTDKVDPEDARQDATGIEYDFDSSSSLVHSNGFKRIVDRYLGGPITLRNLSQMSHDLILYYRKRGQPVVDVVIPEQKITGGTVQIVVVESRVGKVIVKGGCYFDPCDTAEWICCTRRGSRIYESSITNDLFWLNQNPFRQVDVDLRPGALEGTTDVVFEVHDVRPWNSYAGYEDTGVRSLMLERLYAGTIWGNAFGRGGTLSYQYTADGDFRHLNAHAVSYLEPLNRCWSFQTYGTWAGVNPALAGVTQRGESWQAGLGFFRYLRKNRFEETSLSFGFDFKTTNNNVGFGGVSVFNSEADLAQLRCGFQRIRRYKCDEYSKLLVDTFVGPGDGFSSNANTAAFNTIRSGTSTDYIYARGRYEQLWNLPRSWQLVAKASGQIASERLLYSETLGFGGYDSVRGYDQRTLSGDAGWITNLELGPKPIRWCCADKRQSLRFYGLLDAGNAYIKGPLAAGEVADEFLISLGTGLRWSLSDRTHLRVDYAHGFESVPGAVTRDRIHVGLITLFGPRP